MGKKKHKPGHFLSDKWYFPGGKSEKGESFEEALIREMKEELSVTLKIESKICEFKYSIGETDIDSCIFHCTISDNPIAGDDLVEIGFFDFHKILELHDKDSYERLPSEVKNFIIQYFTTA